MYTSCHGKYYSDRVIFFIEHSSKYQLNMHSIFQFSRMFIKSDKVAKFNNVKTILSFEGDKVIANNVSLITLDCWK